MPTDEPTGMAQQTEVVKAIKAEGEEPPSSLERKYAIADNPSFSSLADSFCVACMITRGGNVHAYINKKEAKALASHLFVMP